MSVPYAQTAVASASGVATVRLGPTRAGEKWQVRSMTVTNTSSVLSPEARIYRNAVIPTAIVDVTGTGIFDTSTLSPPIELGSGESLICEWAGCDVGSTSVYSIDVDTVR